MSGTSIPAHHWERLCYEKCLPRRHRYRERTASLIAWLLARSMVRVGLKLCRRLEHILMHCRWSSLRGSAQRRRCFQEIQQRDVSRSGYYESENRHGKSPAWLASQWTTEEYVEHVWILFCVSVSICNICPRPPEKQRSSSKSVFHVTHSSHCTPETDVHVDNDDTHTCNMNQSYLIQYTAKQDNIYLKMK